MNHITKLHSNVQILREWIVEFRTLLNSEKFRGHEYRCAGCHKLLGASNGEGTGIFSVQPCALHPDKSPYVDRKDWISTADVLRYLDQLEGELLP